jgi:hypothetical protein
MASPSDDTLETMVRVTHCCLPSLLESTREEAKMEAVEGMAENAGGGGGRKKDGP